MVNLKTFLGISIPAAIVLLIVSFEFNWTTLGTFSLGYAIFAGIFWGFVKYF